MRLATEFGINTLNNGDRNKLDDTINLLNKEQKDNLMKIIFSNDFNSIETQTNDKCILDILELYKIK